MNYELKYQKLKEKNIDTSHTIKELKKIRPGKWTVSLFVSHHSPPQ